MKRSYFKSYNGKCYKFQNVQEVLIIIESHGNELINWFWSGTSYFWKRLMGFYKVCYDISTCQCSSYLYCYNSSIFFSKGNSSEMGWDENEKVHKIKIKSFYLYYVYFRIFNKLQQQIYLINKNAFSFFDTIVFSQTYLIYI